MDGNVTNFVITNNVVHDNDNIGIDVIGFEGVSPDPAYDYARNGTVAGNTIYNISAINNPGEGNRAATQSCPRSSLPELLPAFEGIMSP